MSAKLLNKAHHRAKKVAAKLAGSKHEATSAPRHWNMLILLPLWVAAAYIVSNLVALGVLSVMAFLHMPIESILRPATTQTAIATVIYALTIAISVGVPYVWHRKTDLATLGMNRLPFWSDIALSPVAFIVYSLIVVAVLGAIQALIPSFPASQTQNVGFKAFGTQTDNMLAFLTLVVLAPIAEETLFRGYLYGKLKSYVPAIYAALVTSLLFGLAHFQWNVSIDVFVLSLILCGLRSLTGSIWAGVLVHMIKNGIAYYILFISPLMGG